MPGTKITLNPHKAKYFLGENILLDFEISYDGDGGLAIDTVGGLGSDDCHSGGSTPRPKCPEVGLGAALRAVDRPNTEPEKDAKHQAD
jgi:hypothetical protein